MVALYCSITSLPVCPSTIHGHCIVVLDTSNCSILYRATPRARAVYCTLMHVMGMPVWRVWHSPHWTPLAFGAVDAIALNGRFRTTSKNLLRRTICSEVFFLTPDHVEHDAPILYLSTITSSHSCLNVLFYWTYNDFISIYDISTILESYLRYLTSFLAYRYAEDSDNQMCIRTLK
jgi:hypothetical protein